MKKTIFLIRNIAPEKYGGAESYQLEMAKILQKNGYMPIIFTASNRLLALAEAQNIKAVKAPYIKKQNWSGFSNLLLPVYVIRQFGLCIWYRKRIRQFKPIAMNIQSRDEWIAATLAGRKKVKNIFWTDHIDFRSWVLQNVGVKRKNLIGKYILKIAAIPKKIIMISDYEAEEFRKITKKWQLDNIETIKNGVVDERKKYANVAVQKNSFCYIGRIVEYKGIGELISAFHAISKDEKATLEIYGDGPDVEKYKKQAKADSNIVFRGFTEEPLAEIAKSSIFVLPSHYEGLSMSLLQAAMLGKPVIATDVDGNPEVVVNGETGVLVPAKDERALGEAMVKLLGNEKEQEKFSKNIRRKYEQEFDFEKTIEEKFLKMIED